LVYAGKALLTTAVAEWVAEEGSGLGVSSPGELATALIAGVDPDQIVVHGMVTSPRELCTAVGAWVGRVVVDSPTEVAALATGMRQLQAVQVRVSPDLDCHAANAIQGALNQPLLYLVGLQCQIGFAGDRRFALRRKPSGRWSH
jgi:diaminopimelate decarboxylase